MKCPGVNRPFHVEEMRLQLYTCINAESQDEISKGSLMCLIQKGLNCHTRFFCAISQH